MNTGMQDAFNLTWKLASVIRNICGDRILDSYSAERSAVGDEVLKEAARLTTIGTLKNSTLQACRNLVSQFMLGFTAVQQEFADSMTEVNIGYPHSPLNAHSRSGHGGPKPGERAPIRDGETPVGAGKSPRFALFANETPMLKTVLSKYSDLLESSSAASLCGQGYHGWSVPMATLP